MARIVDTVLPLMRKTREMLMPHYGRVDRVEYKGAHNHDVVTELDRSVEKFLSEQLCRLYPDVAFAGEEFGGTREVPRLWLCDPIDGTSHFVRGLPYCTSMLALIVRGQVQFSVIYDFVNDIAYHAERGKGAYANGEKIHVSDRASSEAYLLYETRANKPENLARFLKLRNFAPLMKLICAGYEHVLVATGKVEGRVNFDPWGKDYDYAPGSLLVAEAGGIVANIGKRTYDYENFDYIAANPATYQALTEGESAIFPIN